MAEATARQASSYDGIRMPFGQQLDFVKSGALFKRAVTGQGGGKTVAGAFEVRRYCKRHPGAVFICTEPTYTMVRDILRPEFNRQFSEAGETVQFLKSEWRYILPNGAEIWLRQGIDSDKLRGPSVAACWMDEAEDQSYESFKVLCGRIRQTGYPHMFMFTGTPRGKSWLYWLFEQGDRPEGAAPYLRDFLEAELGEQSWTEPESFHWTSLDNDYLDPVTRATLTAAYVPGTLGYRQEVLGEHVVPEGCIYPFEYERHVSNAPEGTVFVRRIAALDWGWTNPGVMLVLSLDTAGDVWITAEVYECERDIDWWVEQGKLAKADLGVSQFFCDPSEPDNIAKFRKAHLDAMPANNAVIPGITVAASRFSVEPPTIHIGEECRNLARELGLYSWKKRRSGEFRPDEPEKANDHSPDAMRYGLLGLLNVSEPVIGYIRQGTVGGASLSEQHIVEPEATEATDQLGRTVTITRRDRVQAQVKTAKTLPPSHLVKPL